MAKQELHRHGCRTCNKAYEDACDAPSVNQRCYKCRTGRPGLYDLLGTHDPRECCFTDCRPPKKHPKLKSYDEYSVYRLSSGCAWWICDTCKTTFPNVKPRKDTT